MLNHFWSITATSLLILSAGVVHAQEIVFGVISTDSSSIQRTRWEPFFRDMERRTGLTVRGFYAPDYAGVIEAMRFRKVDVAWLGNKAAIAAVDRAKGEVFAQIYYSDGSSAYYSLLITRADSPLRSIKDVFSQAGKLKLGIGDPSSTSGYLFPVRYLFDQNRVDYRTAFKAVSMAGHASNIQAVLSNKVDVAITDSEDLQKLKINQPERWKRIRELWRSPPIPSDPLVWRADLSPTLKAKIESFIIGYGKTDAAERAVLKNMYDYGGFKKSSNRQLTAIRDLERKREGTQ